MPSIFMAHCPQRSWSGLDADHLQLTREGGYFVRGVAMVFDRNLQSDQVRAFYARVL